MNYKQLPNQEVVVDGHSNKKLLTILAIGLTVGYITSSMFNTNSVPIDEHTRLVEESYNRGVYEVTNYIYSNNLLPVYALVGNDIVKSEELEIEVRS